VPRPFVAEVTAVEAALIRSSVGWMNQRNLQFLDWNECATGFAVDDELLRFRPPRREHKEATVHHIAQVQAEVGRA
jgi:hypothetical protein